MQISSAKYLAETRNMNAGSQIPLEQGVGLSCLQSMHMPINPNMRMLLHNTESLMRLMRDISKATAPGTSSCSVLTLSDNTCKCFHHHHHVTH
jgi:hypothetical protein